MLTIANILSLVALYWFLKYVIKHLSKLYHRGSSMSTVLWLSTASSGQTLVVGVYCQGFGARPGISNSSCPKSISYQNLEIAVGILRLKPT